MYSADQDILINSKSTAEINLNLNHTFPAYLPYLKLYMKFLTTYLKIFSWKNFLRKWNIHFIM